MKRNIAVLPALLLGLALLAGCGVTTITAQPGEYQYQLNEPIEIIEIETRKTLGALTVTGVEILRDEPFDVQEKDGEDEDGNPICKTVTYRQIVQVFFTYTGSKRLSGRNFIVRDSANDFGENPDGMDPKPEYTQKTKEGQSSFTVALQNPGGQLDMYFHYNILQLRSTARIQAAF